MIGSGIDWTAGSEAEVRRRHRFCVPARLNVGVAACDAHADGRGRLALTCERDGGAAPGRVTHHTFDELAHASTRLMSALRRLGIERGDRVAVFLPQRVECALAHLATLKAGAVSVPLSPLFRADALEYRLAHSGAKVLVTDAEHLPHLAEIRGRLPALRAVLSCEPAAGAESLAAALAAGDPDAAAADTSCDDPAMLIYTSGTSGRPKGALHAHRFLPGRLSGFELIHKLEGDPTGGPFWTPADWAWVGGLVDCVLTPWVFGRPVLAYHRGAFDVERAWSLISRHEVRSLFLPPTAMNLLKTIGDPRSRFPLAVRSVHSAGEPLTPETYAWAARVFPSVLELYGMTEMGAVIGCSPFFPVRPGSMGKPYPGHEVALLDERGDPVRAGEPGEIAIKKGDPGMFLGYFDDPAGTAARFRGDWLVTGDIARVDADGYYHYLGRDDDMFNASGYRVGPSEIEETLEQHPTVERAGVIGDPDEARGMVVKAFVLLRAGVAPSVALADELRAHVKARLATYEYPRKIVFARELPMTVTGKLRRADLRAADADARYGV